MNDKSDGKVSMKQYFLLCLYSMFMLSACHSDCVIQEDRANHENHITQNTTSVNNTIAGKLNKPAKPKDVTNVYMHKHQDAQLILNNALGELALNYSQVFSYEQQFSGLEISRMAGYVHEIYDRDIKELKKDYCVDYFKAVVWMIPIKGGELNGLADTIAHECGQGFVDEMTQFLEFDKTHPPHYRKNYHSELYQRVHLTTDLVDSWLQSIKARKKKNST